MSKILKKERVILNDDKYKIPVSSGNSNSSNGKTDVFDEITADNSFNSYDDTEISDINNINYSDYQDYLAADIQEGNNYNNYNYVNSGEIKNQEIQNIQNAANIQNSANSKIFQNSQNYQNSQNSQTSQISQAHQNSNYREPAYLNRTDRGKTTELIGEEIIAQSQKTAEIIINHTLESAKRELDNVLSDGYKDGYEEGKAEALKIIEPSLLKIKILVDSIKKMQDKMLDEFKSGMFNIISEISNKLLHKEINEKDEYLVELFADAVKNIKTESFVTVTVSGAQIDFAMRNIDLFRAEVANISDFKIIPDKNAEKGTMVVETANALADASYAVQQEKINYIIAQMRDNLSTLNHSQESAETPILRAYNGGGPEEGDNYNDMSRNENNGDDYGDYGDYDDYGDGINVINDINDINDVIEKAETVGAVM